MHVHITHLTAVVNAFSMASISTSAVSTSKQPSNSPWFVTYDEENNVILIWKNNIRLKINGGGTAGNLKKIRLEDEDSGIISVS